MGMMIYMIIMDHQMNMHQHNVTVEERNHYHSSMFLEKQLLPGLSIMNLISFLFCLPVQVISGSFHEIYILNAQGSHSHLTTWIQLNVFPLFNNTGVFSPSVSSSLAVATFTFRPTKL